MAPIATAMPPSDMMLAVMPESCMGMNARITVSGIAVIGMMALGKCHKKIKITRLTMTSSSMSVCFRLSTERSIRSERS